MLAWLRLRKQVKPMSSVVNQKKKARGTETSRAFLFVGVSSKGKNVINWP